MNPCLESMDVALEVPYPRPTRLPACRTASAFFFFFFSNSHQLGSIRADAARFAPMRLDSRRIGFDSPRTELIRPKPGRIGHIRSYRLAADTADTSRKTAETGRNMPETAEISLEYGRKIQNLHCSFFFSESRHSMCLLKIF